MNQEKNPQKMKMSLFDYIFESSIKSSKIIIGITDELIRAIEDINELRTSLLSLSKVIQIHQVAIEDICKVLEQAAVAKKADITFPDLTDKKKDKPN